MGLSHAHVDDAFRAGVATWFAANAGALDHAESGHQAATGWIERLRERGYAAPTVPAEWGGGGYSLAESAVIYEEWAKSGAPDVDAFIVSLHHVPATMIEVGTPEQRERYVAAAIKGTVWCQGFSETGAGSDLAAIQTKARRVEGGWRVSGQKVWSTHADLAEHCLLLARTDPESTRHAGLTYFVLDMRQDGVEVRPIRQNTGYATFSEIFLDEAFIPDANVLGGVGDGWAVAQRTLAAERGPAGFDVIARLGAAIDRLAAADQQVAGSAENRAELARLRSRYDAVQALALDLIAAMEGGGTSVGRYTSALKIAQSELLRDVTALATVATPESHFSGTVPLGEGYVTGNWFLDWLGSWAWTISGGTNEVQRSIIAEKVLGMPREPKVGGPR